MLLYCAQELNNNQSSLRRWEYTVFPPSEALRRLWKAGRLPDFFFLADDGDVCNLRRCEWTRRSTTTAAAASSRQIAPCWLSNVLCATHYVKWKGLITSMHTHTQRERDTYVAYNTRVAFYTLLMLRLLHEFCCIFPSSSLLALVLYTQVDAPCLSAVTQSNSEMMICWCDGHSLSAPKPDQYYKTNITLSAHPAPVYIWSMFYS